MEKLLECLRTQELGRVGELEDSNKLIVSKTEGNTFHQFVNGKFDWFFEVKQNYPASLKTRICVEYHADKSIKLNLAKDFEIDFASSTFEVASRSS